MARRNRPICFDVDYDIYRRGFHDLCLSLFQFLSVLKYRLYSLNCRTSLFEKPSFLAHAQTTSVDAAKTPFKTYVILERFYMHTVSRL